MWRVAENRAILEVLICFKNMRDTSNLKPTGKAAEVYDYLKANPGKWVCSMENTLSLTHHGFNRLYAMNLPGIEAKHSPRPSTATGRPCLWLEYNPLKVMSDPIVLALQDIRSRHLEIQTLQLELQAKINEALSLVKQG